MVPVTAVAILVAFVLDASIGEPPDRFHPVAWFGTLASGFDRDWRWPHVSGWFVAAVLPLGAGVAAGTTAWMVDVAPSGGSVGSVALAGGFAGFWLFVTTSRRQLREVARDVLESIETDTAKAREEIGALVGRDTSTLSPGQLRSATVESAAENLADGLVAPLLAFVLGAQFSLAVGVGAAVWVKAVNTLDSMLGYPEKPHGTASARLDDVVMWPPARLSAFFLSIARLDPAAILGAAPAAAAPSSPNSGWPMATLASLLDVRLEKPGGYEINGRAALPTAAQARRGIAVVDRAALLAFAVSGVIAWF